MLCAVCEICTVLASSQLCSVGISEVTMSRERLVTSVYNVFCCKATSMCHPAKRVRDAPTLPSVIVKQLIQYIPHNTYLYLYKTDREPACCQQSLFGVCSQCDAARRHAAKMWPCLRKIRSPGTDEAGRSLSDRIVNGILELHLHMQHDTDYEPKYLGDSISRAHTARAAWKARSF
jgi:hypothetical protein